MSLRAFSLMICLSGCAGGEAEEGPPQSRPIGEESDADADSDADSDADADTDGDRSTSQLHHHSTGSFANHQRYTS
jgi:hypothetical protein